jgi:hypothetical protein
LRCFLWTCRKNRKIETRLVDLSPATTYAEFMSQKSDFENMTPPWQHDKPYNTLPALPPATELES